MKPVGSTAVRDAIVTHQPMLSVHGHIHESRGVTKMGRTLTINPGSVYTDGVLQGAVIDLNEKKGKVTRYILVNGWTAHSIKGGTMATVEEAASSVGGRVAGSEAPTLFLRKATGLVRGWSVRDAIIYACLSTNIITLGIYEFSFNSFIPKVSSSQRC